MNRRILVLLVIAVMLSLFIVGVIQNKRLHKDFVVSNGVITELNYYPKHQSGKISFKYRYEVDKESFSNTTPIPCDKQNMSTLGKMLTNRSMPIVYYRGDPGISDILLTKKQFDEYKLDIPEHIRAIVDSITTICSGEK